MHEGLIKAFLIKLRFFSIFPHFILINLKNLNLEIFLKYSYDDLVDFLPPDILIDLYSYKKACILKHNEKDFQS